MASKRAWILYSLIRVLAIVVPFAIVMLAFPALPYNWLLAIAVGSVVGIAVSYLFLRDARTRMGADLAELRARRDTRTALDREEDDALEAAPSDDDATGDEPEVDGEPESPASTREP